MKFHLIILTLLLTGCNYVNTEKSRIEKVESCKLFFIDNQEVFDRIVHQIRNGKKFASRIDEMLLPKDFDEITNKQLRRLEIEGIIVSHSNCDQLEIEFTTSWTNYPIGRMYIGNYCDDEQTTKGHYEQLGFIEVWGLGNGWLIWLDSDPI